jgi:uncharacterized repeat protein (TIGR01451 family)
LQIPGSTLAQTNSQCLATKQNINNQASYNYNDSASSDITVIFSGLSNQLVANIYPPGSINIAAKGIVDKTGNLVSGNITGTITEQLVKVGLTQSEANKAILAVAQALKAMPENATASQLAISANNALLQAVPEKTELINTVAKIDEQQAFELLKSILNPIQQGDVVNFEFLLFNPGTTPAKIVMPDVNTTSTEEVVPPGGQEKVTVEVTVGSIPASGMNVTVGINSSNVSLQTNITGSGSITGFKHEVIQPSSNPVQIADCSATQILTPNPSITSQTVVMLPPISIPLKDPLGAITGCAGQILPDYNGFSVGFYEPADSTGGVAGLIPLTGTELPDIPNNNIYKGVEPNKENSNPFFLTNGNQGKYNFLLDKKRGQVDRGRTYILLVNPPAGSNYSQRRIRIVIGDRNGNQVAYTATALDGKPISATDNRTAMNGTIDIPDADRVGLVLAIMNLNVGVCDAQDIQIIKTGDRAAAEPGDTVIYRLSIRNLAAASLDNIVITDTLPQGFQFRPDSVRGEFQRNSVPVTTNHHGSTVQFTVPGSIARGQVLNIAYAALLTPDAMRGTGRNSATVNARRSDNNLGVKDGPAIHQLRLKPGILTDYGTIIGRVFVDKNFDGEQQRGEPGVPNAVIFMDDGNRITTDANGLFSVKNVIPGYRTGVLDFSSIPGYTLAPNRVFKERNSQSRLVHLAPGSLVRMNFAVTPAAK